MIVVDTSIWVDHFRAPTRHLADLIRSGQVAMHPYVVAELAVGKFPDWDLAIADLRALPGPMPIEDDAYYAFIAEHRLMGSGISFVGVHLLASVLVMDRATLWTRDKRLSDRAEQLGRAYHPD